MPKTKSSPAQQKEYHRTWYLKNLERERLKRRVHSKLFRDNHPEKKLRDAAKNRAKDLGVPFDLELCDIIIPELCPVLGVPLIQHTRHAASLDRIVPELGYVKGNIQIMSRKANVMKNDATPEELRSFALWVQKTYQLS